MEKIRIIVGLMIITIAVSGVVVWETMGREYLYTEKVLVAATDILSGEVVMEENLKTKNVPKDLIIKDAFYKENVQDIIGKRVLQFVPSNSQIALHHLEEGNFIIPEGNSVFPIKGAWIDGISSSIRRGDYVGVYSWDGTIKLGKFQVAFVKDNSSREIGTTVGEENIMYSSHSVNSEQELLQRENPTGIVEYIEIISSINDYQRIAGYISENAVVDGEKKLLVVQEVFEKATK